MPKDLNELIKENFERGTLTKVKGLLKGRKYRVNVINRDLARDLSLICSLREFQHKDDTGRLVEETIDCEFEILTDNVIPGVFVRNTIDSRVNKGNVIVEEQSYSNPMIPNNQPMLIVKTTKRTNLNEGFFNKLSTNVYVII